MHFIEPEAAVEIMVEVKGSPVIVLRGAEVGADDSGENPRLAAVGVVVRDGFVERASLLRMCRSSRLPALLLVAVVRFVVDLAGHGVAALVVYPFATCVEDNAVGVSS